MQLHNVQTGERARALERNVSSERPECAPVHMLEAIARVCSRRTKKILSKHISTVNLVSTSLMDDYKAAFRAAKANRSAGQQVGSLSCRFMWPGDLIQ